MAAISFSYDEKGTKSPLLASKFLKQWLTYAVATAFFTFLQLTYDEKKLLKLPNRVGLMKNYLLCTTTNDKRTNIH